MTEVIEHPEGADPQVPRRGPGQTRYEPLTLEKGLSEDNVFESWANQVATASVSGTPDPSLRKDLRIEIYDEAGNRALAYTVYRCWPSEFQVLPALDGSATGSLLQVLKLEHEGWERDLSISATAEAPPLE
jgi:phage tail-like protein